mmetsp:Transcript_13066/g.27049  ORF Transcript_13066/g.27049 Transcript_13066/m.27049 type:complete len:86 (-) Transcript_13066:6-263(-)
MASEAHGVSVSPKSFIETKMLKFGIEGNAQQKKFYLVPFTTEECAIAQCGYVLLGWNQSTARYFMYCKLLATVQKDATFPDSMLL